MKKNKDLGRAIKIKGYGSYESEISEKEIQKTKILTDGRNVKITIIHSLREYVDFISTIETTFEHPVFYRGHTNANYLLVPSVFRAAYKKENCLIESFYRRFSHEIDKCNSEIERLVLMQHYGLPTRCLDITESPLAALYFACNHNKKFPSSDSNENFWGEVILFRDEEESKTVTSSMVSVMSSPAFLDEEFNLWQLGMRWKKDINFMHDESFIDLKEIILNSCIVRVPQNNPRIKNQHGAFIITTANEVYIKEYESCVDELTKYILNNTNNGRRFEFNDLIEDEKYASFFKEKKSWYLYFRKIKPYDEANKNEAFRTNPFDLNRLLYKKDGVQQVVLIPSQYKAQITKELEKFNFTEDFIYPDMDNVAHEIYEKMRS